MSEDISREGVTFEKVAQLGRLLVPDLNHAIAKVGRFALIDLARINELLGTNFRGVILDFDECVAPHHGEATEENEVALTEMVRQRIKLVIFSNMKASERYRALIAAILEQTGYEIRVITSRYAKPDPRGFAECLEALELEESEEAVMIGDNFVTDGGAISAGIPFIRVSPIKTEGEPILKRAKRSFQTGSRAFYALISDLYDLLLKRKVLRDDDFDSNDRKGIMEVT